MPDYIINKLRDLENAMNECGFTGISAVTNAAADEIERLRKERDELRREVCEYATTGETIGAALLYANSRGWDCFKEEEHGKTTMG